MNLGLGYGKAVAVLTNHCYGHTDLVLEPSCLPFPTTDPLLFVSVSQNLAQSECSKNILWPGFTLAPSGHQHGRCCFSSTEVTGGQRGEMVCAGSCGTSVDFLRDWDEGPLTLWPHALAFPYCCLPLPRGWTPGPCFCLKLVMAHVFTPWKLANQPLLKMNSFLPLDTQPGF